MLQPAVQAISASVAANRERPRAIEVRGTERSFAIGTSLELARRKALLPVDLAVRRQAGVVAFETIFLIMGISFVIALPLLFLFRTGRVRGGSGGGH